MPRISSNPISVEKLQAAKMKNLRMDNRTDGGDDMTVHKSSTKAELKAMEEQDNVRLKM